MKNLKENGLKAGMKFLDLRDLSIQEVQKRVDPIAGCMLRQMIEETKGEFSCIFPGDVLIYATGTKK